MTNANILADIATERDRQIDKWGMQRHDFHIWMTVLGEEFGEVCQAVLEVRNIPDQFFLCHEDSRERKERLQHLRAELIQVAAVAVAAIEHADDMLDEEAH